MLGFLEFIYLAENSSNVSSSCPPLLRATDVLKADLRHVDCTCGASAGALLTVLRQGLKREEVVDRAASRKIEVEAMAGRGCGLECEVVVVGGWFGRGDMKRDRQNQFSVLLAELRQR
jgi:hypothetical protein